MLYIYIYIAVLCYSYSLGAKELNEPILRAQPEGEVCLCSYSSSNLVYTSNLIEILVVVNICSVHV